MLNYSAKMDQTLTTSEAVNKRYIVIRSSWSNQTLTATVTISPKSSFLSGSKLRFTIETNYTGRFLSRYFKGLTSPLLGEETAHISGLGIQPSMVPLGQLPNMGIGQLLPKDSSLTISK